MHPAALDQQDLLKQCTLRRQRRSGPGGQHRNKVETAIFIQHTPTGVGAEASERRSQQANRTVALFRLRVSLAIEVREAIDGDATPSELWQSRTKGGKLAINAEHEDFPAMLAEALDRIAALQWDVKGAAAALGCSTSQLVKLLQKEPRALALVNTQRASAGQSPMK